MSLRFSIIARAGSGHQGAAPVTSMILFDQDEVSDTYYAAGWDLGSQIFTDAETTIPLTATEVYRSDIYIGYGLENGVIVAIGNSLINSGYSETTYDNCAMTTERTKWYSLFSNLWYSKPIQHPDYLLNGIILEDGYNITWLNGETEATVWACPWGDDIYENCYDAQYTENQITTFYSDSETPLEDWLTGTPLFADQNLEFEAPDGTYYVNRGGQAQYFEIVDNLISGSLDTCNLPSSFEWWTSPHAYYDNGSSEGLIWADGLAGFQVGAFVYKEPQLTNLADPGYYYLNSGQYLLINMSGIVEEIVTYPGKIYGNSSCDLTGEVIVYIAGSPTLGAIVYSDVNNRTPSLWSHYIGSFTYASTLWAVNSSGTIVEGVPCST